MGKAYDQAGNIWETDANGNPIRFIEGPRSAQPPPDPEFPYKGQQAGANVTKTLTDIGDTNRDNAREDLKLAGELFQKGLRVGADGKIERIPDWRPPQKLRPDITAAEFADAIQGYQSSQALGAIIADLKKKYNEGPGSTKGLRGVKDFLGGPANQAFDKAANAARGTVGQALGFTGGQLNSAAEAQMNVGPFIPQASDWDTSIEDSIRRLEDLKGQSERRAIAILGGIPDENGNITPVLAEFGATQRDVPVPQEMQAEHAAFVNGGNFTPEQYADFREALDRKYKYKGDRATYIEGGKKLLEGIQNGGTPGPIPPVTEDMSLTESLRNSAANNPFGAAAIGFANMGGFGGVQAFSPEQYAALSEARPGAVLAGEIGGSIFGSGMLGRAGGQLTKRIAPKLAGEANPFIRSLATDATYGGIYGGVTEGDPLTGAALGAAGSAGGQATGKVLGDVVGGVVQSAPVENLLNNGITMTTARRLGSFARNIEDAASSIPVVGDMIGRRSADAIGDFNSATFKRLGANNTGERGLAELWNPQGSGTVNRAYTDALTGVSVPIDQGFSDTLAATRALVHADLPENAASSWERLVGAKLDKVVESGNLSGEDYQRLWRTIKTARNKVPTGAEPFETVWKDSLNSLDDEARALMTRQGAAPTVDALKEADRMYRDYSTLKDAVYRARKGTGGDIGTFTPGQLVDAGHATARRYPGPRPFADIADDAQRILPSKLPDSGTARRIAQQALLGAGALGTAGGGAGYAVGGQEGATQGATGALTLGALLTALGTRRGQAVLNAALFKRSDLPKNLGEIIRNSKGILGSAAIPLAFAQPQ